MHTLQDLYDWREGTAEISGMDLHHLLSDLVGDMSPSGRLPLDTEQLRVLAQTSSDATKALAVLEQAPGYWATQPNYFDKGERS